MLGFVITSPQLRGFRVRWLREIFDNVSLMSEEPSGGKCMKRTVNRSLNKA